MDPGLRDFSLPGSSICSEDRGSPPPLRFGFLSELPCRKCIIVKEFTPSWFTVPLGISSVGTSIGMCPFQFPGQVYLAWVFFFLAAAMFVVFSCLPLDRVVFYRSTVHRLLSHPNQSLFLGAIPMCVSSLTCNIPLLLQQQFAIVTEDEAAALFWVNLPAVLLCIVLIPFSMFTVHDHGMHSMTAVWLLPVVPATMAAHTAGLMAQNVPEVKYGGTLIFMGLAFLGIGLPLSFQVCTIYYNRLTCHSLPAREVIVSSFLPVGSMAMAA